MTAEKMCPDLGQDMDLIIVIMSAPLNLKMRMAIRQTWGSYNNQRNIGIVFMLGSTNNNTTETKLNDEQILYGDIVRGQFIDSYTNLTLKSVSTLEWVDTYCPKAKFFLKTDDDMFINVDRLISFIKQRSKEKKSIYGRLAKKWKPVRNNMNKYYVSKSQYKLAYYPDFCTGPAYLMSNNLVHDLYEKALNETYLKLEDVFVTGIVASKLGIKRVSVTEFYNRKISYNPCIIRRGISVHMVKFIEQFDLWKKLHDENTNCKKK